MAHTNTQYNIDIEMLTICRDWVAIVTSVVRDTSSILFGHCPFEMIAPKTFFQGDESADYSKFMVYMDSSAACIANIYTYFSTTVVFYHDYTCKLWKLV